MLYLDRKKGNSEMRDEPWVGRSQAKIIASNKSARVKWRKKLEYIEILLCLFKLKIVRGRKEAWRSQSSQKIVILICSSYLYAALYWPRTSRSEALPRRDGYGYAVHGEVPKFHEGPMYNFWILFQWNDGEATPQHAKKIHPIIVKPMVNVLDR